MTEYAAHRYDLSSKDSDKSTPIYRETTTLEVQDSNSGQYSTGVVRFSTQSIIGSDYFIDMPN